MGIIEVGTGTTIGCEALADEHGCRVILHYPGSDNTRAAYREPFANDRSASLFAGVVDPMPVN